MEEPKQLKRAATTCTLDHRERSDTEPYDCQV